MEYLFRAARGLAHFAEWLVWHGVKVTILAAAIYAFYLFSQWAFVPARPFHDALISFTAILVGVLILLVVAHKVNRLITDR